MRFQLYLKKTFLDRSTQSQIKNTLTPARTFYLVLLISTSLTSCSSNSFSIHDDLYPTVKIGQQLWAAKNLKTSFLDSGVVIIQAKDEAEWSLLERNGQAAWRYADFDSTNIDYGYIYNSQAVDLIDFYLRHKGWRVPREHDWKLLFRELGNGYGHKLRAKHGWKKVVFKDGEEWVSANNSSGFSAIPNPESNGEEEILWSISDKNPRFKKNNGSIRLGYINEIAYINEYDEGMAIRLIENAEESRWNFRCLATNSLILQASENKESDDLHMLKLKVKYSRRGGPQKIDLQHKSLNTTIDYRLNSPKFNSKGFQVEYIEKNQNNVNHGLKTRYTGEFLKEKFVFKTTIDVVDKSKKYRKIEFYSILGPTYYLVDQRPIYISSSDPDWSSSFINWKDHIEYDSSSEQSKIKLRGLGQRQDYIAVEFIVDEKGVASYPSIVSNNSSIVSNSNIVSNYISDDAWKKLVDIIREARWEPAHIENYPVSYVVREYLGSVPQ